MNNSGGYILLISVDRKPLRKYNEIVGFAVMAEWQTRQLEGLVGVTPVEVRVFLAASNKNRVSFIVPMPEILFFYSHSL